jgi:hypothetical protein
MTITMLKVGKVSSHTKGPSSGPWAELQADAVHCNMNVPGMWYPQPATPLRPWECLIYS